MSSALRIDAYSTPMTPAPTTTTLRGKSFMRRISSLSTTVTPSNGMLLGRTGREPVAIRIFSP